MAYNEVEDTHEQTDEDGEEETVELRRIVVLDKTEDYPVNGVNRQYSLGDVLAFRKRQAERYVEKLGSDIRDARYARDDEGEPEEPYEKPKSELRDELGKVGEVPDLKDQLAAMQG